jgi:hypothetical protein
MGNHLQASETGFQGGWGELPASVIRSNPGLKGGHWEQRAPKGTRILGAGADLLSGGYPLHSCVDVIKE